jgi:predicted GTPase
MLAISAAKGWGMDKLLEAVAGMLEQGETVRDNNGEM